MGIMKAPLFKFYHAQGAVKKEDESARTKKISLNDIVEMRAELEP